MNDTTDTHPHVGNGRWKIGYTLIGQLFADGAAEIMPVTMFTGGITADTLAHAEYARLVANPAAVHITLTNPAGTIIETARTDITLPPAAKIGTQLSGYGYNEYDQVTHTDGTVWYIRSLTTRIFPNGETALVAVNVTDHVDHGLCKTFPPSHLIVTADGRYARNFCPHGQPRNQTTIADTDDITACCATHVGITGDGHLHCRCCHSAITGGHQTQTHHINL